MITNQYAGGEKNRADKQRGEDLETAVAVRVILIRRPGRDDETDQDDARGQDVTGGFEAVRYQSRGVGLEADDDFEGCQGRADDNAGDGNVPAGAGEAVHPSTIAGSRLVWYHFKRYAREGCSEGAKAHQDE